MKNKLESPEDIHEELKKERDYTKQLIEEEGYKCNTSIAFIPFRRLPHELNITCYSPSFFSTKYLNYKVQLNERIRCETKEFGDWNEHHSETICSETPEVDSDSRAQFLPSYEDPVPDFTPY